MAHYRRESHNVRRSYQRWGIFPRQAIGPESHRSRFEINSVILTVDSKVNNAVAAAIWWHLFQFEFQSSKFFDWVHPLDAIKSIHKLKDLSVAKF